MCTLKEARARVSIPGISDETIDRIFAELARVTPGEKIYSPAIDLSKKQDIVAAARTLPSGAVAERYGVTRRYVNKIISRK